MTMVQVSSRRHSNESIVNVISEVPKCLVTFSFDLHKLFANLGSYLVSDLCERKPDHGTNKFTRDAFFY